MRVGVGEQRYARVADAEDQGPVGDLDHRDRRPAAELLAGDDGEQPGAVAAGAAPGQPGERPEYCKNYRE
ncbi:hypothetical protein GCM10027610_103700 [Dactylosporangium cerinum]